MVRDHVGEDDAEQALFDQEMTELFRDHHLGLFRFLRSLGVERNCAEEIVNDAFLVVCRQWAVVRRLDKPSAYLFKVARIRWSNIGPRRARQLYELGGARPLEVRVDDPCDGVIEEEAMLELLSHLSQRYREVLLLRDVYGFGNREVADILKLDEGTVKRYRSNARERLRKLLEETSGRQGR